ncbi:hypothetical protein [Streptomyces enissocaesilis]|uniref:Aminoglycoside phosphotransferase domain-containing protein n=1 Tax=Streptomyces enissocaesilis TaxID=332589 RepID=A0ABP6J431_9ACTN
MSFQVPMSDVLRSAVGTPAEATVLESGPRSRVWRVDLRGGDRVVVKQIADVGETRTGPGPGPGAGSGSGTGSGSGARSAGDEDARYAREVAALRLAARAARPARAARGRPDGPGTEAPPASAAHTRPGAVRQGPAGHGEQFAVRTRGVHPGVVLDS